MSEYLDTLFSLEGKVAIVTGGTGVLGSALVAGLARAGARVGVLGRRRDRAEQVAGAITLDGGEALALPADVLAKVELEAARDQILSAWQRIDVLVNAAGGNMPGATVSEGGSFFDLSRTALEDVIDLNLMGTILPCQVFGAVMAARGEGCIVNISSLAAGRALTRVAGYGAAKSAVEGLTRWLAVELSRTHGAALRVNAIAPGFFAGEQNRRLLMHADGTLTPRGEAIVHHTPAGRFGKPDELVGTLVWLCSPGAAFVNGIVVPVDGGFSAFSGV